MRSALPLLTAIACLATAAPAASAADRDPFATAVYTVSLEAKTSIDWNAPEHISLTDCFHQYYAVGSGGDEWSISGKGLPRARIVAAPGGRYELQNISGASWSGSFKAGGRHERTASWRTGSKPGKCGGEAVEREDPERCRGIDVDGSYAVDFSSRGVTVSFTHAATPMDPNVGSCKFWAPKDGGPGIRSDMRAPFKPATLKGLAPGKELSYRYSKPFTTTTHDVGGQKITAWGTAQWTLTLARVAN